METTKSGIILPFNTKINVAEMIEPMLAQISIEENTMLARI
jgi:hypothetical protein